MEYVNARLRVSVVALFLDQDDVLLLHQMTPPEPDCWDLPGGGLDPHEPLLDGLRREVWEETGIMNFQVQELLTVTELFTPEDQDHVLHTINIVYRCEIGDRSHPLFSEEPEIGPKGIQWIPIQSLRQGECSRRC
jgi:ADP-ribose pyrophosphatase YjhB (NUDIX family)